jgi:RimJ/RimL family protein N-acetyltransferase
MGFEAWRRAAVLRSGEVCFTATEWENQSIVGVCAYRNIDYRNGRVDIWAAVLPDFGGGAELLLLLAQTAFDHLRIEHAALPCLADDARTIGFAGQAGFTRDAIFYSRIKKNDKRYDVLLYTLLKGEGGHTP